MFSPEDGPAFIVLTDGNFDLHQQGSADQRRFKKRVEEAVKKNLPGVIARENIILSDGEKIIKIPIHDIELPHFRHGKNDKGRYPGEIGVGQGSGQPGRVIGGVDSDGSGKGKGAGNLPGIDYFEADYTIDELAGYVYESLGLPFIKPKPQHEIESEDVNFSDIRKKGPISNLDKRRTIKENLLRNALAGHPRFSNISEDDLRFKTWETTTKPQTRAVVLAMRDVSSSMGEFEKYITRSLYFWAVRYLRSQYDNVDIVFITHHTDAKEVNEDTFFNLGESGGTRASSAYKLALDIMKERYPSALWNRYPLHVSDGDNWGELDNSQCLKYVQDMLNKEDCSAFGYFEIRKHGMSSLSTLMSAFQTFSNPHLITARINKNEDVYPALQQFFDPKKQDVVN